MNEQDLQGYKQRLQELRSQSRDELHRMIQVVLEESEIPGEHDHKVSESLDKEISLERSEETLGRAVMDALRRIENGSFGVCEGCGQPIATDRLDALPFTPHCIACERQREEGGDYNTT